MFLKLAFRSDLSKTRPFSCNFLYRFVPRGGFWVSRTLPKVGLLSTYGKNRTSLSWGEIHEAYRATRKDY